MKKKLKWENTGNGNSILRTDKFYISYNKCPWAGCPAFRSDTSEDETALVEVVDPTAIKGGKFYILNGDFRKEYEKLVPKGLKACKEFYDSKKDEFGSSWSNEN